MDIGEAPNISVRINAIHVLFKIFNQSVSMNKTTILLFTGFMLSFLSNKAQFEGARMVTEINYPNCIELMNDSVRIVLEPNLGGRILVYELNGNNVLYVDHAQDGKIYEPGKYIHPSAGRFDIGPEHTIPEHPALYLGKWTAGITGDREAEMISQKDSSTGVQLIRKFKLAKSGSRIEYIQTIKNISNSTKSYCHWSRTFVKGGGIALAPLNKSSRYPKGYLIYGPGRILNYMPDKEDNIRIREGILEITGTPSQPKIVTDSYAGWLAYITTDDLLFIKIYPASPLRNYGEIAASTACFYYRDLMCEVEPISPMESIEPGHEASFTEHWYLFDYRYPNDKQADLKDVQNKIVRLQSQITVRN